jgi:hypothetical protein
MKLRNLGIFCSGAGGMAWFALELPEVALVLIGLLFMMLALMCACFRWGEYLAQQNDVTDEMREIVKQVDGNDTVIKVSSEESLPVMIYSNGRWSRLGYDNP